MPTYIVEGLKKYDD